MEEIIDKIFSDINAYQCFLRSLFQGNRNKNKNKQMGPKQMGPNQIFKLLRRKKEIINKTKGQTTEWKKTFVI